MKNSFLYLVTFLSVNLSLAQTDFIQETKEYQTEKGRLFYPIHEKSTLSYLTNTKLSDSIVFDAKVALYLNFYNNFDKIFVGNKLRFAGYATFQPHIRMYEANSKPVRTPSYKINLGFQVMKQLNKKSLITGGVEIGHYSNGQTGCAFSTENEDLSDACNQIYASINNQTNLSGSLNRVNGNYSSQLARLALNYQYLKQNPSEKSYRKHSTTLTYERLLKNIVGSSEKDHKIYGNNRAYLRYEFDCNDCFKQRFSFLIDTDYLFGTLDQIKPFRLETSLSWFPYNLDFGFSLGYISGHDNYNYRVVDNVQQLYLGLRWDWFKPFSLKNKS